MLKQCVPVSAHKAQKRLGAYLMATSGWTAPMHVCVEAVVHLTCLTKAKYFVSEADLALPSITNTKRIVCTPHLPLFVSD